MGEPRRAIEAVSSMPSKGECLIQKLPTRFESQSGKLRTGEEQGRWLYTYSNVPNYKLGHRPSESSVSRQKLGR